MIIIVIMCLLAFIARKYYRRTEEGSRTYKLSDGPTFSHSDKPLTPIYTPPSNNTQASVLLKHQNRANNVASV